MTAIRTELAREWRALSKQFSPSPAELAPLGARFSLVLGPVDIPEDFEQATVAYAVMPNLIGSAKLVGAEVSGIISETGASIDQSEVQISAEGIDSNIFTDTVPLVRPESAIGEYLAATAPTSETPSRQYVPGQVFAMMLGDSEYAIKSVMTVLHFETLLTA